MKTADQVQMSQLDELYWFWLGKHNLFAQLVPRFCPSGTLLDVGCGTGSILQLFSKTHEVHGIDVADTAVKICKERGLEHVHISSAEKLPYRDSFFDGVILSDVLEHVADDKRVYEEVLRVTKPKGIVLITVPAFEELWNYDDVRCLHYRRYSKEALLTLIRHEKLIQFRFIYFFLYPIVKIIRKTDNLRYQRQKQHNNKTDSDTFETKFKKRLLARQWSAKCTNYLLLLLNKLENMLLRWIHFPIGVCMLVVVRKK